MQNTRGLALEIRLSAYLDGEISEAERRELEDLVSHNDEARLLLDMLQAGSTLGNQAFEEVLHDPVPLSMVRRIKQGPSAGPIAERIAAAPPPLAIAARTWPRLAASALVIALAGGAVGYVAGTSGPTGKPPVELAAARTWLDDIAVYHRIFAGQTERLVEVPGEQVATIESWLSDNVGVPFKVPQLTAQGLSFEGARLLVAGGKPTAQLIYKGASGEVVALCFLKNEAPNVSSEPVETTRDDLALVSWQTQGTSFVIVGPSADTRLGDLAKSIRTEI